MFKSTFGDRIKMLRTEKDLTQDEMAVDFVRKTGVIITKSSISYYEHNKRTPEAKMLESLADYFDVSVDFILARTDERKATVKADDGLSEDNVKFREYSMIYDTLRQRLIEEGVLGESDDFTPDLLKLFLILGEDTAVKVLKAKGIDPSALLK